MATLPLITGACKVVVQWGLQNVHTSTGLHFRYNGSPGTQAQWDAVASAIQTAANTNLRPALDTNYAILGVLVEDLASPVQTTGAAAETIGGSGNFGSAFGSACVLANYRIARRYRGGHPRSYWPLLGESMLQDAQHWNSGGLGTANTAVTGFINAVASTTAGPITLGNQINISYFSGGTWSTASGSKPKWHPTLRGTPVIDDVLQVTLSNVIASQRRRLGR